MDIREKIKEFIIEKVRKNTNEDRPFFFVRGSGLHELCKAYSLDLLEIIDELAKEKKIYKGLVNGKLVLYLHRPLNKKRLYNIKQEFEEFIKG